MSPQGRTYFQVILPLKLEWEPWYYTDEDAPSLGERVEVCFAGRLYSAVVSSVGGTPDVAPEKVQPSEDIHRALEPVLPEEIRYWRFLARYYMCTVGEVFKTAYPAGRDASEEKKSRKHLEEAGAPKSRTPLSEKGAEALGQILEAFKYGRAALLEGEKEKQQILSELAAASLEKGRSVLLLTPSKTAAVKAFKQFSSESGLAVLGLHSPDTYPQRREIARILRSGDSPRLIIGTRSALYLPWRNLGLVIVDSEQDAAYKIDSQAPRINGRDAAIALAAQQKANCILCTGSPSLEALYNCANGKFRHIRSSGGSCSEPEFIDTQAEARKNGMVGEYSRKLLSAAREAESQGGKVLYICPWPQEGAVRPSEVSEAALKRSALVAILHGEALSLRQDFRADEKLIHFVSKIRENFKGRLIIQTSGRTSLPDPHSLLEERKQFSMPPYTRLVDIIIKDKSEKRLKFIGSKLQERLIGSFDLQGIIPSEGCLSLRLTFAKDRYLEQKKGRLYDFVTSFEKEFKYTSHIFFNVDP